MNYSPHPLAYFAHQLTRRAASNSMDRMAGALLDAQVDLNPHQIDAALFATSNPLSKGAILADEVGLGKTIEAGLLIAQKWAERKHRILVITPANLRKQWHQGRADKLGIAASLLEATGYRQAVKEEHLLAAVIDAVGNVFDADVTDCLLGMPGSSVPLPRVDNAFRHRFRTTSPRYSRTGSISPPPTCRFRQRYNSRSTSKRHW